MGDDGPGPGGGCLAVLACVVLFALLVVLA
jgi:hypothetical protein